MNFAVIDIIFIALIVLFTIRCYLRGFVKEFMSMAGIALGLLAALFLFKNGAEYLRERFWSDLKIIPEILAFIVLFVIVFVLVKLVGIMLKGIIEGIRMGGVDRALGFIFGFAEGVVVVSLVLFILRIQPLFDPTPILADSFFANLILPLIIGPLLPAEFPMEADLNV